MLDEFMMDLIVFDNSTGASEICVWMTSTIAMFPFFLAANSSSLRRRLKGVAPYSSARRRSKIWAYKYVSSRSQQTLYIQVLETNVSILKWFDLQQGWVSRRQTRHCLWSSDLIRHRWGLDCTLWHRWMLFSIWRFLCHGLPQRYAVTKKTFD